jgi:PilZ domain
MPGEKRQFLRFECIVPVEDIRVAGADVPPKTAALLDVSREGLHIIVDLDYGLKPGRNVDFNINIPDKNVDTRVSGEVMWVRPKDGRIEVGIKITNMNAATKSELLEIGYLHWQEERRKELEKKKKP